MLTRSTTTSIGNKNGSTNNSNSTSSKTIKTSTISRKQRGEKPEGLQ